MPLLANIFSRKSKPSRQNQGQATNSIYSNTTSEAGSTVSSPLTEYGYLDRPLPSSPNGKSSVQSHVVRSPSREYNRLAPPASKLRLFGRKKAPPTSSTSIASTAESPEDNYFAPQPPYLARVSVGSASDSDLDPRRLKPPPAKSAIFAAYGDPQNALSTRSLPNESNHTPPPQGSAPPPIPSKKPAFFQWKSSPSSLKTAASKGQSSITLNETPSPPPNSSFNLKSFRHIRPPSPTRSDVGGVIPNSSNVSLHVPVARPRGASVASEASQRISVAAFREAQARRSAAGSPAPSFRAPSPNLLQPPNSIQDTSRGRSSPRLQAPLPPKNLGPGRANHSRSVGHGAPLSDSDESEESSEESEAEMQRAKSKARARSEMGHGSSSRTSNFQGSMIVPSPRLSSAHVLSQPTNASQRHQPHSQAPSQHIRQAATTSQPNANVSLRSRASVSTSALTPSAVTARASTLAAANNHPNGVELDNNSSSATRSRHNRGASTQSVPAPRPPTKSNTNVSFNPTRGSGSDSSSDSEDDAPLASLVPPRRPGSALSSNSNNSNSRSGPQHKPLIDISTLVSKPPVKPGKAMPQNDGFTQGATLLAGLSQNKSTKGREANPLSAVVSRSPPTRFISPPSSPKRHSRQLSEPSFAPRFIPASPSPQPPNELVPPHREDFLKPPSPAPSAPQSSGTSLLLQAEMKADDQLSVVSTTPSSKRDALNERLNRAVKKQTLGTNELNPISTESTPPIISSSIPATHLYDPRPLIPGQSIPTLSAPPTISTTTTTTSTTTTTYTPTSALATPPNITNKLHVPLDVSRTSSGSSAILSSPATSTTSSSAPTATTRRIAPATIIPASQTPELDLADVLGGGVMLIKRTDDESDAEMETRSTTSEEASSRNNTSDEVSSSEESDHYGSDEVAVVGKSKDVLTQGKSKKSRQRSSSPPPIAPIPIKQRLPPPAFSVTSRPQKQGSIPPLSVTVSDSRTTNAAQYISSPNGLRTSMYEGTNTSMNHHLSPTTTEAKIPRKRSSTLVPSSNAAATFGVVSETNSNVVRTTAEIRAAFQSGAINPAPQSNRHSGGFYVESRKQTQGPVALSSAGSSSGSPVAENQQQQQGRQRSSTMLPLMTPSPNNPSASFSPLVNNPPLPTNIATGNLQGVKPFSGAMVYRRDSPATSASSTTGDSARTGIITPRDGSEIGSNLGLTEKNGRNTRSEAQESTSRNAGNRIPGKREKEKEKSSGRDREDRGGVDGLGLSGATATATASATARARNSVALSNSTNKPSGSSTNLMVIPAASNGGRTTGVGMRPNARVGYAETQSVLSVAGGKRRSVSFEDELAPAHEREMRLKAKAKAKALGSVIGGGSELSSAENEGNSRSARTRIRGVDGEAGTGSSGASDSEARRKERRRSEAKAAIELGKVINGRGPIMDDGESDLPVNQSAAAMQARMVGMNTNMGGMNPMMGVMNPAAMGMSPMGMPNMAMGQMNPMGGMGMVNMPMLSPAQFMPPMPVDANMLAVHQQAMAYAKQAYQMAVAQQAMAAAGDEWERGSVMSGSVYGGGGGSVYGGGAGGSVYGGGASGSVYGGGSGGSVYGGGAGGWSTGSTMFPAVNPMMFVGGGGISSSRSDYGGPSSRTDPWNSSRSTYGESFGPSERMNRYGTNMMGMGGAGGAASVVGGNNNRSSKYAGSGYYPMPPMPERSGPGEGSSKDKNIPSRNRVASQPSSRNMRKAPPSSWKPSPA